MLGNDIGSVGWPTSGEIDIMENVGFEPNTVHGTLHGPGYSGCCGLGGAHDHRRRRWPTPSTRTRWTGRPTR